MFKMEKRFCPKCKSENVVLKDNRLGAGERIWVCHNCGFDNIEFPVKEKLKIRQNLKKN